MFIIAYTSALLTAIVKLWIAYTSANSFDLVTTIGKLRVAYTSATCSALMTAIGNLRIAYMSANCSALVTAIGKLTLANHLLLLLLYQPYDNLQIAYITHIHLLLVLHL